jgi:hypothetical protein
MQHGHELAASPVSFNVNVARLPQKGMPVVIEADAKQLAALAEEHGVLSVKNFRAELHIGSWKRNGVKVSGVVTADIEQACVVTLDPLEAHIEEEVSALFLPEDSKLGRMGFEGGGEIVLDAEGPDSPEIFSGDTIDVGALAEEFFGLAIDPYPRKSGASLEAPASDAGEEVVEGELQRKLRSLMDKS